MTKKRSKLKTAIIVFLILAGIGAGRERSRYFARVGRR